MLELMFEGIMRFIDSMGFWKLTLGQGIMMGVALLLMYLAIRKGFEPLLLLPIGLGAFLTNLPLTNLLAEPVGNDIGGLF